MTVTLLLVAALMQIFNATTDTWQHGEAQVDAYREARGALQLMARDLSATLQASYVPPRGAALTAVPPALPTLCLQHASGSYDAGGGPINEEVYCLTNIPNSGAISGMSSLCAVGYFCQWMPDAANAPANTPQAYALMREALDSNGTFLRIQTASGHNPVTFDDLFTPTTSAVQLAAYIWDLRLRIDTDLNEQSVPDGNLPSPPDHAKVLYRGDASTYPTRLPAYVEIRFKALSDIAGRRLEGTKSGVDKTTWKDNNPGGLSATYRSIIQPSAQQFVLRVPLINATPLATPAPTP